VLPCRDGRVLLGLKRRGFGAGLWNGFGGKVDGNDVSVRAGALRELQEEACITAQDLRRRGTLTFHWKEQAQPWEVAVYSCTRWTGEPGETEEMSPKWFAFDEVPFDLMWQDDRHWWPLLMAGDAFKGGFYFQETSQLVDFELHRVDEAALPDN
jgi:8-oxo-dGTP pyrophosphatase MutT (NUDIX family)